MASTESAIPAGAVPEIPRSELRARIEMRDPDLVLVDVLPPDSYAAGHLPIAVNVPYATMSAEAVRRDLPDPHADTVVYCGGFT
ncbi:MAG: rhodanese-like domain-containing protein [Acidobacteria bacterium]|nr:rhodanese-like domain-containing protein [Acidobacteriota bacterium]